MQNVEGKSRLQQWTRRSLHRRLHLKILINKLLLQGNRCGSDHQALTQCLRHNDSGNGVGYGFTRTRTRLDDTNRWRTALADFARRGNASQRIGDFCDHLPLAPARRKRLALYNGVVGLADTIFEVLAQQGVDVLCASLLTTALAYMPSA